MLDAQEYAPPVHTHNAVPLIDLALSDRLEPGVDASVGDHLTYAYVYAVFHIIHITNGYLNIL